MIKTSRQLKDKIRNMANGSRMNAQTLIRNYVMERFLERISVSNYHDNFILKGGMLVASLVGLDTRATMDIDTTIRSISLTIDEALPIINEIAAIELNDNIKFKVTKVSDIMEEHEYPGIRFVIDAVMDNMKQPIKLDISTGDAITPSAIVYSYKLMFEDRSISLCTYNIETLLAEKLETIMSRGETNTRMRDFYDIYAVFENEDIQINHDDLKAAFAATCRKRDTYDMITEIDKVVSELQNSEIMESMWMNYMHKNQYVGKLSWNDVIDTVKQLTNIVIDIQQYEEQTEELDMSMV